MSRKQSSSEIVYNHVSNSSRLARRVKRLLESQLIAWEHELADPKTIPQRKSEIIVASAELLNLLSREIENGSKLLVSPVRGAGHEPKEDVPDVESIMNDLVHGKVARGSKP
jgi:hypothetical protein